MKAIEARAIFNLLNNDKFSWDKISEKSSVAILQVMMDMSEANDKLTKAEEFARNQIVAGRVKELIEKHPEGVKEGDEDYEEYKKLVSEAQKKMNDVLLPKYEEDVNIPLLSKEDVAQIIASNGEFFRDARVKPFALFLSLTTKPKKEEDN